MKSRSGSHRQGEERWGNKGAFMCEGWSAPLEESQSRDHGHRYVKKTREHTRKFCLAAVENSKAAKANVSYFKSTDFASDLPLWNVHLYLQSRNVWTMSIMWMLPGKLAALTICAYLKWFPISTFSSNIINTCRGERETDPGILGWSAWLKEVGRPRGARAGRHL